jgi:5'-deoxynucleotidase YfbR-like HD superfamily hydrolase
LPRSPRAKSPQQLDLLSKPDGRTAIVMASGFIFDLMMPDATGMPIEDIARALSSQPRWGGATRPWYSVAEHSVMASRLVPPADAYDALMHDCEEFLGDLPSPFKELIGRDVLRRHIGPIKRALAQEFGFKSDNRRVKQADLVCMATELRDLLPDHWMEWGHLPEPAIDKIVPVGPERAYQAFLDRYHTLRPNR